MADSKKLIAACAGQEPQDVIDLVEGATGDMSLDELQALNRDLGAERRVIKTLQRALTPRMDYLSARRDLGRKLGPLDDLSETQRKVLAQSIKPKSVPSAEKSGTPTSK